MRKLTKKQFYAIYGKNRKMLKTLNYYLIESEGDGWHTIEGHPKLITKVVITFIMPFALLFYGIANWRELLNAYLDITCSKKRGSHSVDKITQETLDRIKSL